MQRLQAEQPREFRAGRGCAHEGLADEEGMDAVPLHQLADQQQGLTRARSVATRVFTAEESAASHCQAGNYQLALDVMLDWLRLARERE